MRGHRRKSGQRPDGSQRGNDEKGRNSSLMSEGKARLARYAEAKSGRTMLATRRILTSILHQKAKCKRAWLHGTEVRKS